ncbi:MAG: hypothetical protein DMF23_03460 [Verrucomicrobia bacterium]|nr:MAG: hypothetical protein DMF23_03460 [Verrucomicrobiota bacterium]
MKSLKPIGSSGDKMSFVPLNTPRDNRIDRQVLFAKEKRCGAPLPTALHKAFFGLRRQSEATTALFTRAPPGEKRNTAH